MICLDSVRAKEIMHSPHKIEVLYNGSEVWIDNVKDNNSAEITYLDNKNKLEVPVYKLIENNPSEQ
jgi:H-type small acid-soluble spore protein